jgi:hypothetical protein
MNAKDKKDFDRYIAAHRVELLNGLKLGEGRPLPMQEENYGDLVHYLSEAGIKGATDRDVTEAAGMVSKLVGRPLETSRPPTDNGAARKLANLIRDSSTVQAVLQRVDVRLDIDQMKHQSMRSPIGTRNKGGGNRFVETCNAAWHRDTTMLFMARWANAQEPLAEGETRVQRQILAQTDPLFEGAIHFEGSCLKSGGTLYALFHCYPANNSPLLGPKA